LGISAAEHLEVHALGDLVPLSFTFHTLTDTDLVSFCAGTDGAIDLEARLTRYLESGMVRPEWCWLAFNSAGMIAARHYWWSRPGSDSPFGVDHVSAEVHSAAVELLVHARDELAVNEAFCEVTAPIELGDDPSQVRADLVSVLGDSGFDFEVARVTVEWTTGSVTPSEADRLTFRPARSLDERQLVGLFQSVGDRSLDHAMVADRARIGADQEARERLANVRSYPSHPDWFVVAFDGREEPVGYVVPAFAGDVPIIAEIGVAVAHRGHGYVSELLSWATRCLVASGATRIVADTDRANTPMRAAFTRGGYREFRLRDDYLWERLEK
jgi:RimJ/RimL family protein N-acetyltransferase